MSPVTPEESKALKSLESDLDSFREKLEKVDYSKDEKAFFTLMQEFWAFISWFTDERLYSIFEHSQYFALYQNFFSKNEEFYVRALETVESLSVLTNKDWKNISFYDKFTLQNPKEVYKQTWIEIWMLDLEDAHTLVMVGCWPLPETILFYYENTLIDTIVALDNNQEAVVMAGKLIRSQSLNRIKTIRIDGTHYDYKDADIICLANFVSPKSKVFDQIAKTAKVNVQIVTRTPILFWRMLYEDTVNALNSRLAVVKESPVNPFFLAKTLLIKKLDI